MASIGIAILLFSLYSLCEGAQQKNSSIHIPLGSSLSPETHPSSWPSTSGLFEFGFYQQGSGLAVGIWLVGEDRNTTVWTANRDDPPLVLSPNNTVLLQLRNDGKLVLTSAQGNENYIIASATNGSVSSASMLDSGNFVLYNEKHEVIWESFNHPTDTILGGQTLPVGGQLVSSLSDDDHSTGRFQLNMQADGKLVMYPANSENSDIDAYWTPYIIEPNESLYLYLNSTDGALALINTTSSEVYQDINSDGYDDLAINTTVYRATVGVNGVLRVYSHKMDANGTLQAPIIMWYRPQNPCDVRGVCGLNSYCTLSDNQPDCLCLPGSDYADLNRRTMGCLSNYSQPQCATSVKENTSFYDIFTMENLAWPDTPDFQAKMTMEQCRRSCLEDCNCGAALFNKDDNNCMKQKPPLRYVRRDLTTSTTAFFKVSKLTMSTESNLPVPVKPPLKSKKIIVQILVLTLGLIIFSCIALAISGFYIVKIRVLRYKRLTEINGNLGLADEELTLRVFSYNEMRRATNGFKQELGKGSFGAVYKGALNKGKKLIAVKRLEKLVEEGEREFRAEMQSIGRTHHKNLVRLLGYSAERSKRLLVYEYMSNGSLADLLFKAEWHPAWDEKVRIAVDVARGLLYLHEECKSPIIHCDIKPQNILMDEFWNAKISDFGLAKLLMPDQTRTFTGIRGTRGYLAPEWHKNTPISVKADVYSFGIVLLELMCCRRNLDVTVRDEEIILSAWVYKCFVSRELHKLTVGSDEVIEKSLENMVKVALWCIQDEPAIRPSMKSVVLMLQGITDISIPPCPTTMSS